jgi:hypothetical protein
LPAFWPFSPPEFILCSQHKIAKLSRGSIPFFPATGFKGGGDEMADFC